MTQHPDDKNVSMACWKELPGTSVVDDVDVDVVGVVGVDDVDVEVVDVVVGVAASRWMSPHSSSGCFRFLPLECS